MPTYEYRCKDCGHEFEINQAFTDDALTECPECHGALKKKFGSVGIAFKGSGFYKTDSRSGSSSSSGAGSSSAAPSSSSSSDSGGDSSSSSSTGDSSSSSGSKESAGSKESSGSTTAKDAKPSASTSKQAASA